MNFFIQNKLKRSCEGRKDMCFIRTKRVGKTMPETSFVKTTLTAWFLSGQGIEIILEEIFLPPKKINTEVLQSTLQHHCIHKTLTNTKRESLSPTHSPFYWHCLLGTEIPPWPKREMLSILIPTAAEDTTHPLQPMTFWSNIYINFINFRGKTKGWAIGVLWKWTKSQTLFREL